MALDLEQQETGVGEKIGVAKGCEGRSIKEFRIEEARIRVSRSGAISRLLRTARDRDPRPDFEHISKSSGIWIR
jgi:hypothetical protein